MHTQGSWVDRLWWVYFVCLAIVFVFGLGLHTRHHVPFTPLFVGATLIDLAGLAGLFLFIRDTPALAAGFWRLVFLLLVMQTTLGAALALRGLFAYPWHDLLPQRIAALQLLMVVLCLPWIYAIGRYAFGSPQLWNRRSQAST